MQTRSRSRLEPEEVPLQFNHERTRVPTAPIEPRDNSHEESLQRRITELEAQLRAATIQTLHGSRASRTISREDTAGNELNSINILGYPFLQDKQVQTKNCMKFRNLGASGSDT